MKLLDIELTNFKKISNLPQPTIVFNPDINVLVGANNAGKTSILKAVQKLFKTEEIEEKDLNYLVKNGNLTLKGRILFEEGEWEAYLDLVPELLLYKNTQNMLKTISRHDVQLTNDISFIKRKQSMHLLYVKFDSKIVFELEQYAQTTPLARRWIENLQNIIPQTDFYNVYKTPLFLDSKGEVMDHEPFIPLNKIESQKNQKQANIRGLLYALKRKDLPTFEDFKKRLLKIFTELEDIDVVHNEDLGRFELVLFEKLGKNGDTEEVQYDINSVGQGMQSLVLMLSNILLLKPKIVLMDEPEAHMHPSLIKEFVKYIRLLSADIQFIITTHSLVLINEVGLDKVFALKNDPLQKGIIATKVDDRNKLLETMNDLGYSTDALTYTIKPTVVVFTEGPSDKELILFFAQKAGLHSQINSFNTAFVSMDGKGNRYKLAGLIDKLNKDFFDTPLIMILDKDETADTTVEDITNKFFSKNPKRVHYLNKRQIENYLIDKQAINQVVSSKIKIPELLTKWQQEDITSRMIQLAEEQKEKILNNYISELFTKETLINTKDIQTILRDFQSKPLRESVRDFSAEMSKLFTLRTFDLGQKTSSAIEEFEKNWGVPSGNNLELCDGRILLKAIRRWIEDDYRVSFSNDELIEAMPSIPPEIAALLDQMTKPHELKIT